MNSMSELIDRLEKEIQEQTKYHKEYVTIDVNDLNELGYGIDPKKKGKADVDVTYLKIVLKRYKFKDSLKVGQKQQTFRQLEHEIKQNERKK